MTIKTRKRKKAARIEWKIPSMVIAVAKALAKADGQIDFDTLPEMLKYQFTKSAVAALKAMRDPTPEIVEYAGMVEVGSAWVADMGRGYKEGVTFPLGIALLDTGCRDIDAAVLGLWREMIDYSLNDTPEKQRERQAEDIPF